MESDDRFKSSPGTRYYPEAFEPEPYKLGKVIADDVNFCRALLQYVLLVLIEPLQLVHFRAAIINEVIRSVGHDKSDIREREFSIPKVTWCALSLATDRYFEETARGYGWNEAEAELIRSQWYDLMAPAFVPSSAGRRLGLSAIQSFTNNFGKLHDRDMGPFPACDFCTAKCQYKYEVEHLTKEAKLNSEFKSCIGNDTAAVDESIAWFGRLLTNRLVGTDKVDLAYCITVHLMEQEKKKLQSEDSNALAEQVYTALTSLAQEYRSPSVEEQILEVVVRQALAGARWKQTCASAMEKNNITEEQVEAEIRRRQKSIIDLFALDSHGSAAVLSGRGVRALALQAIAKQASAGLQWQEISSHTVKCFNITKAEVDAEMRRLGR